jgi:MarR family transcriptional regulator for hemolysin
MQQDFPNRSFGFVSNDVARLMRKRFDQRARAAALGLTRAQSSVLANLARHEGINQAALAQLLDIEPITLARLLDRLQAANLIERRPDLRDRRAHRLYLTDAAFPLVERMFALGAEVREEALAGIPESDRERLIDLLITIKSNLARRAEAETFEAVANG